MTTSFQRALQAGDRALIACEDLPELHASVERAMQTLVATHLVCQSLTPQLEPVMRPHFLHRIEFLDSEQEPEPPAPRKLDRVVAGTWAVILVTAIAVACAIVHVVALVIA